MEFCLALQELAVRLTNRMNEIELVDVLQRNMLPSYQDRLLFMPIANLYELKRRCQQIEEMWRQQAEVQQIRRAQPKVHELAAFSSHSEGGMAPPRANHSSQSRALDPIPIPQQDPFPACRPFDAYVQNSHGSHLVQVEHCGQSVQR